MRHKLGSYAKLFDLPAIQVWTGIVALGVRYGIDGGSSIGRLQLLLPLIAITLVLFFMMASNDYFDMDIDRAKGERAVLLSGEIGQRQTKFLIVFFPLVGLALSYFVSTLFLILVFSFFMLAVFYSAPPIRYKRAYPFSTLGEIAGVFLLFPIGYVAIRAPTLTVWLVSSLPTLVATRGRLRHEARHVEFDKATGKRTFAVVHGAAVVSAASRACLLVGTIEVPILFLLGYFNATTAALAFIFIIVPIVVKIVPRNSLLRGVSLFWGFGLFLMVLFLPG